MMIVMVHEEVQLIGLLPLCAMATLCGRTEAGLGAQSPLPNQWALTRNNDSMRRCFGGGSIMLWVL